MDDELKSLVIHRSLTRPLLFMGGERVPMLLLFLVNFTLVFIGMNMMTLLLAGILQIVGSAIFVNMAKADPRMFSTYAKHIKMKGRLSARTNPWSATPKIQKWN